MDVEAPRALLRLFDQVEDPRVERSKLHRLSDILVITLCGVICGADGWTEVETVSVGPRSIGSAAFWNCPTGFLRTTPSAGSSPA